VPSSAQPAHWRVMADLVLLSLFAGLYSVPMYALIQMRSQPTHRARIIAANNILNALFMVVSALLAGALLSAGFGIIEIFLLTGLANLLVAGYIFWWCPSTCCAAWPGCCRVWCTASRWWAIGTFLPRAPPFWCATT